MRGDSADKGEGSWRGWWGWKKKGKRKRKENMGASNKDAAESGE